MASCPPGQPHTQPSGRGDRPAPRTPGGSHASPRIAPVRARLGRALVAAAALAVLLAGTRPGARRRTGRCRRPAPPPSTPPTGSRRWKAPGPSSPARRAASSWSSTPSGSRRATPTPPGGSSSTTRRSAPTRAAARGTLRERGPARQRGRSPGRGRRWPTPRGTSSTGRPGCARPTSRPGLPTEAWSGAAFGPGLLDPAGAEVHLVLTDLGPADGGGRLPAPRARRRVPAGSPEPARGPGLRPGPLAGDRHAPPPPGWEPGGRHPVATGDHRSAPRHIPPHQVVDAVGNDRG